jgi:hypothetical protein
VEEVLSSLDEEPGKMLSSGIIPRDWHPYDSYMRHVTIDKTLGDGDSGLCRKVGRYVAKDNPWVGFLRLVISFGVGTWYD